MFLEILAAFQNFSFLQVSDVWDCWYIRGEVKVTCLGQRFPNCGLQTLHACVKHVMRSAKKEKKKVQVLVFFQKYFEASSWVCWCIWFKICCMVRLCCRFICEMWSKV
jgi:hypothetical protein